MLPSGIRSGNVSAVANLKRLSLDLERLLFVRLATVSIVSVISGAPLNFDTAKGRLVAT
jgi:hypothetical protein